MNAPLAVPAATLESGAAFGGGIFVSLYRHGDETRALIIARLADWKRPVAALQQKTKKTEATSFVDGLANTDALAAAGSEIAQEVRALRIGGFDDWHIPAINQLELVFRRLRPTGGKCSVWNRNGMNTAAIPPAEPYSVQPVGQTEIEAFRAGGVEAMPTDKWYWTSTQHAGYSGHAWVQHFSDGDQYHPWKGDEYRVLAVRSEVIR